MNLNPRQSRITLLLFLFILIAGQVWVHLNRPIYPDPGRFPENWPPQGCLVDANALKTRALKVFPRGTTAGAALVEMSLEIDIRGSGLVLPRASVLYRSDTGWRIRPMSQAERFVWRIPMELLNCTQEDLLMIRGVGPVLAGKIHRFVQERGYLESVDELEQIPGVGPKKLAALRAELALY